MSNTISRAYPGDLAAGTGLTFRAALNLDRTAIYNALESMETLLEAGFAAYFSKGTIPTNTALCYVDDPTPGRVYCPVGYKAVIGGVPVVTVAILSQVYTGGILSHVFLVAGSDGAYSLRVSSTATEGDNETWIADVTAEGVIDNAPTGKPYAYIDVDLIGGNIGALLLGAPTITVGEEAADIINVAVQLKDVAGNNPVGMRVVRAWLSDDASGAVTTTEPDTAAIGTDGVILYAGYTQSTWFEILTDATGSFDLNITQTGARTVYLFVECQGVVYMSDAITFAA